MGPDPIPPSGSPDALNHKMLVRIANREDLYQTVCYLCLPFRHVRVQNFKTFTVVML